MDWGNDLWDQYDVIDKHTQSGLELMERYIKFVKERTDIEQSYAKQLRSLTKRYAKRSKAEELECRFTNHASFQDILNELNDYAGQRELVAENLVTGVCVDLSKYLQELKTERKSYLIEAKKAQHSLEASFKQLETIKKRCAKEWAEAEKALLQAEKIEQDTNATKADVEKVKQHSHARVHSAEECRNDYAAYLQRYNKEQHGFYYTDIPLMFNKLQDMDEKRGSRLAAGYLQLAETERNVTPIISCCLDGIASAAAKTNPAQDSMLLVEQHKSGFERPGEVEFEDYSQTARAPESLQGPRTKPKLWPFIKKNKMSHGDKHMPPPAEDYSHLPPEQRRKKLQARVDDVTKDLQKETDQSEALEKMKSVYQQNPALGDPASLEPQISHTSQTLARLRGELAKYESWLSEAVGGEDSTSNNNYQHSTVTGDPSQNIYSEFDDDFDDLEVPVGQCTALYSFEGSSEGTISVQQGEQLSVMEQDKGDGWIRVQRASGDEGYIPSSYTQ
ncbi:cdc42-interacting protein 4 homolog isoform X2 [Osmerus eperlanus]|uniref:cdc42-interacting protein 4 homolog isoform X2 n=1 Tax=Osmerus eperlanus TaxID=29151 RepID=UPI002E155451